MAPSIIGVNKFSRTGNVAVIKRSLPTSYPEGSRPLFTEANPTVKKFNEFWDLMELLNIHGYVRAAINTIGKSAIGAWWSLRENQEAKSSPALHRRRLLDFYNMRNRNWDNIKDFQSQAYKLMIGVMYLHYFGQVGFNIVRDNSGRAVGFDHLPGLVVPNVDEKGFFKKPAFYQFSSSSPRAFVEYSNPKDIVYITNPDFEGSPLGGTSLASLSEFTAPLDIYLMTAAREYMKNRDTPEVVYQLPADISEEAFDEFVTEMESRRAGASNLGRNPIAVQGEFDIKELRPLPNSLPYQESRKEARDEVLAVSGVSGAKLGLTDSMASSNIRELRREFHETTMVPLFKTLELAFFEQIHIREFNIDGWEFKFNSPDFLNAVERATVHMRYSQMGAMSPNEIRYDIGKQPRTDPAGDAFEGQEIEEPQGSPPEGRPVEPDDPSQTGEPTDDDQDPERGDQHDEEVRDAILADLRKWRSAAIKRIRRGRRMREFETSVIPAGLVVELEKYIGEAQGISDIKAVFDEVISYVEEEM